MVDHWIAGQMKQHDIRVTRGRELVLRILANDSDGHPTA